VTAVRSVVRLDELGEYRQFGARRLCPLRREKLNVSSTTDVEKQVSAPFF
jgi:hypothetical protein